MSDAPKMVGGFCEDRERCLKEIAELRQRYKNDLHNFMELERWLEKHHPEIMDEWESAQ